MSEQQEVQDAVEVKRFRMFAMAMLLLVIVGISYNIYLVKSRESECNANPLVYGAKNLDVYCYCDISKASCMCGQTDMPISFYVNRDGISRWP